MTTWTNTSPFVPSTDLRSPLFLTYWRGDFSRKGMLFLTPFEVICQVAGRRHHAVSMLIEGEGPMDWRQLAPSVEPDGSLSFEPYWELDEWKLAEVEYMPRRAEIRPRTMLMAQALKARRALRAGDLRTVKAFTTEVPGRRGTGWPEAVSTALAGPWSTPLFQHGRLPLTAWDHLVADARTIYRQMMPLWKRRVRGARLLLLDMPLGDDGTTLIDLIDAHPSGYGALGPEWRDGRIDAILQVLRPQEQAVVGAWTLPGVTTWADAAWAMGVPEPEVAGERIRRRVRRIALEQSWRIELGGPAAA